VQHYYTPDDVEVLRHKTDTGCLIVCHRCPTDRVWTCTIIHPTAPFYGCGVDRAAWRAIEIALNDTKQITFITGITF
jgi:hypothetical protein